MIIRRLLGFFVLYNAGSVTGFCDGIQRSNVVRDLSALLSNSFSVGVSVIWLN